MPEQKADYDVTNYETENEGLKRENEYLIAELAKVKSELAQLNDALVKFVSVAGVIGNAVALFPRVQVG